MPIRAMELRRRLWDKFGLTLEPNKSGGSHHIVTGPGIGRVPLTLHNGWKEEISEILLKKLCKQLGIDRDELMK